MFLSAHRARFWQPAEEVFFNSRKGMANIVIFQMKVSSKCSCGNVERNFDVLARNFIQKYKFSWLLSQNVGEKRVFKKFSSNGSYGHVEFIFSTPQEKHLAKGYVFFAQLPNLIRINFFSIKKYFQRKPPWTWRI